MELFVLYVQAVVTNFKLLYKMNNNFLLVLKLDEAVDLEVYTPVCLPAYTDTWTDGKHNNR